VRSFYFKLRVQVKALASEFYKMSAKIKKGDKNEPQDDSDGDINCVGHTVIDSMWHVREARSNRISHLWIRRGKC
jgi:hypothetical protein